jgi:hypothetical protein
MDRGPKGAICFGHGIGFKIKGNTKFTLVQMIKNLLSLLTALLAPKPSKNLNKNQRLPWPSPTHESFIFTLQSHNDLYSAS